LKSSEKPYSLLLQLSIETIEIIMVSQAVVSHIHEIYRQKHDFRILVLKCEMISCIELVIKYVV